MVYKLSTQFPHVHREYYKTVINMHSSYCQEILIQKTAKKMITTWCPLKVSEGNATTSEPATVEIQPVKPNPERGSLAVNQI